MIGSKRLIVFGIVLFLILSVAVPMISAGKKKKEKICNDGIDNDGDTDIDCLDKDCKRKNVCREKKCGNGIDDDGDSDIDCADSNCKKKKKCKEKRNCYDGIDNDMDGDTDCADTQCAKKCTEKGRKKCKDKKDNDRDGQTDCEDTECASQRYCKGSGTSCTHWAYHPSSIPMGNCMKGDRTACETGCTKAEASWDSPSKCTNAGFDGCCICYDEVDCNTALPGSICIKQIGSCESYCQGLGKTMASKHVTDCDVSISGFEDCCICS